MKTAFKVYFLSVRELIEADERDEIWTAAAGEIDAYRQQKLAKYAGHEDRARCIGAGLLIKLAKSAKLTEEVSYVSEEVNLRDCLDGAIPDFRYHFTEKGKPSIEGFPYRFSISHSGEYVMLAVSDGEIGADIQIKNKMDTERLSKRFFSEKDLEEMEEAQNRTDTFFRIWTRKEAFAKYTGEGIARVLGGGNEIPQQYECANIQAPDGYAAAVCFENSTGTTHAGKER